MGRRTLRTKLTEASHRLAEVMYQQAQAQQEDGPDQPSPGGDGNGAGAPEEASADGDVVDALVRLAGLVEPPLDDLDAVQVGAVRITQCADHEAGGATRGGIRQIAACERNH